jgi:hypothetical protein
MPITVIPADENAGAIAGWQMLHDALQRRWDREAQLTREKKVAYQALISNLSDPNTTEEQQNAILSQDPKQFHNTYGVPIESVGKDVARIRAAAGPGMGVAVAPGTPGGPGIDTQRILVPHPGGTAQQQQQAATLASTKEQTAADIQRRAYYEQATQLTGMESVRQEAEFNTRTKQLMRTAAGKVPTIADIRAYKAGNLDLYPTTPVQEKLDSLREIVGGDQNDPAVRMALFDLASQQDLTKANIDHLKAETEAARGMADERAMRLQYMQQGIDPDTGKSLTGGIDPKELVALGNGFNSALNNALGPFGFPSQTSTVAQRGPITQLLAGRLVDWWSMKTAENPRLAAALFGTGNADPVSVRADLLATAEPGRVVKTISFPSIDPKTGLPSTTDLTIDQAVPLVTQLRRKLVTELPPVFAAMRQAAPRTLLEMAAGNPLIEQAAKSYAPDIAAALAAARTAHAAEVTAAKAPPQQQVDQNMAPLLGEHSDLQKQLDDLRNFIQGSADHPRNDANR